MWEAIKAFFTGQGENPYQGHSILVVDDDKSLRTLLSKILTDRGFTVTLAPTGTAGIESAQLGKPDLIILDCDMPDIKGNDVCRRLKDTEATKDIPVLFLTSDSTPENIIDCYDVGAFNYLAKPISRKELLENVERTLRDHDSKTPS